MIAICRVWPWTLTYQKFLLCISIQGQVLYLHQKVNMYIYWFSSESSYRRRQQRRTPQYNHLGDTSPIKSAVSIYLRWRCCQSRSLCTFFRPGISTCRHRWVVSDRCSWSADWAETTWCRTGFDLACNCHERWSVEPCDASVTARRSRWRLGRVPRPAQTTTTAGRGGRSGWSWAKRNTMRCDRQTYDQQWRHYARSWRVLCPATEK